MGNPQYQYLHFHQTTVITGSNKKLSCRRQTVQCFVSLKTSPSHSRYSEWQPWVRCM